MIKTKRHKKALPQVHNQDKKKKTHLWAYWFLLPTVFVLALFDYYPLLRTIVISTQGTDLFGRPSGFVGFDHYKHMFASGIFGWTLLRTFIFVIASVLLKLILGLAVAIPLSSRLAGSALVRPLVLIPMAFSSAVASVVFKTMLVTKIGTVDQMLSAINIDGPGWLTDHKWGIVSIILADTWVGIGLVILLLMAAIDSLPDSVMEAASIDGAGVIRKIWSMMIPLITPTIFFIIVTQSIQALREFTIIHILTGGGPHQATTTLTYQLYLLAFGSNSDYGPSAAHGIVLMVIVGAVSWIQFKLGEKRVNY